MRLPIQIYVATQPVSLHLSFDRLAGLVREALGGDPRAGHAFLFHNKRTTHVKLLWHDGRAYRLLYCRLDRGHFRIPMPIPVGAACVEVSQRELDIILEGIDDKLLREARRAAGESSTKISNARSATPMT